MAKTKHRGGRPAAFIFDLDGTLIDSGADIAAAANFVRSHFDLPPLPAPQVIGYVGDGVIKLLERLLAAGGETPPAERVEEGLAVFRDHYGRHCLDATRLYPGVLEVLMRFRELPLMVATNKPRRYTDRILEGLRIAGAFRRVVAAEDTPHRKPHPGHLLTCLEGLDVPHERVVVVGDHANDIESARGIGAVSVGVTFGLTPAGMIRAAGPDFVIDSFGELAELFSSR